METRNLLSSTAFNTLNDGYVNLTNDVYSFDSAGGTPSNPLSPPKNSFYINASLNPTPAATLPSTWTVDRYLTGDFSGDRALDIAVQVGSNWYIGTRVASSFVFNTSIPSGSTPGTGNSDFLVGNFYGTGYNVVTGVGKEDIAYRDSVGTWKILPSNESWGLPSASGFNAVVTTSTTWAKTGYWEQIQKLDVNNDRLDDIVGMTGASTQVSPSTQLWVARATGTDLTNMNFTAPDARSNYMFGYALTGINVIQVGDFNRDGQDDLAAWNQYVNDSTDPNKIWVGLSTGSSFDWDLPANVNELGGGDMPWGRLDAIPFGGVSSPPWPSVGDFNADVPVPTETSIGHAIRDDLLYITAYGMGTMKALMSNGVDGFNRPVGTTTTGSGMAATIGTVNFSYSPIPLQNNRMVGDLNNDGREDLWVGETNGTAFRIFSTAAPPPAGSGLTNGFGLSREFSSYMNWSLYPSTFRVFGIVGRYWA